MAEHSNFEIFVDALGGGGDRLLFLVEDPEADAGWRVVPEAHLAEIWQSFQSSRSESNGVPDRLCYNLEQAAKVVGISVHKLNSWLRMVEHLSLTHRTVVGF